MDLLKNEGYWLANLDNIQLKEGKALLKVFIGNKYESLIINRAKSDVKLAKKSSLHRFPRHMTRLEIPKLKAAVVRQFEDSGFPFANVRLDSFQVINSNLSTEIIKCLLNKTIHCSMNIHSNMKAIMLTNTRYF